jgi:hypothetical protein
MTTREKETSVSVTLSVKDWIVIGSVFVGLVAWGVRLEMGLSEVRRDQAEAKQDMGKLEDRIDRSNWRRYGPTREENRP